MKPAGYARISQDRETSTSVKAQIEMLQRWATMHGHDGMPIHTDEGVSAFKEGIDRPGFAALLADIDAGRVDTIVVKSPDRLSRRLRVFAEIVELADVITVEGGIDTTTAAGRMMASLLATFGQYESENAGARQKISQDYRRRSGRSVGRPPYGYVNVQRADGSYRALDPDTKHIAREIVERVLDGDSIRSVAEWLNSAGHRSKEGKMWSAASVSQWLERPQLAGLRGTKDGYLKDEDGLPIIDEHLAIITLDERRRIIAAKEHRRQIPNHGPAPQQQLLSGLVYCAECGRHMTRKRANANGRVYQNYACTADNRGLCGTRPNITETRLENYVKEQLAPLMSMPVINMSNQPDPVALQRRELLRAEIDTLTEQIRQADAAHIPDLAEQLARTRERHDAVVVDVIEEPVDTGQTLADLWEIDPKMVINSAIERIEVRSIAKHYAHPSERVDIFYTAN